MHSERSHLKSFGSKQVDRQCRDCKTTAAHESVRKRSHISYKRRKSRATSPAPVEMADQRINHIFSEIGTIVNNLTERAQGAADTCRVRARLHFEAESMPYTGEMTREEEELWLRDYKGLSNILDSLNRLRQLHKDEFLTSKQGVYKLFAQAAVPLHVFLRKNRGVTLQ